MAESLTCDGCGKVSPLREARTWLVVDTVAGTHPDAAVRQQQSSCLGHFCSSRCLADRADQCARAVEQFAASHSVAR